MTTATALTPGETLVVLEELLQAATERAAAELRMEGLKEKLDADRESLDRFEMAVYYEIKGALSWHERDDDALQACQDIQDAIDVLKFAI